MANARVLTLDIEGYMKTKVDNKRYTSYVIGVKCFEQGQEAGAWAVLKRFNAFLELREKLKIVNTSNQPLPSLPKKMMFGNFSASNIKQRAASLQRYGSHSRVPSFTFIHLHPIQCPPSLCVS